MASKRPRDRKAEYEKAKAKRQKEKQRYESPADSGYDADLDQNSDERQKRINGELVLLSQRTAGEETDADRDIDFAYSNHGNPALMPLMCPSIGAWQWCEYARLSREKFLQICAKREDEKRKQAGTVTSQRMEDDKRKQFAIIDRIARQLTVDVKEVIDDLMAKFPREVLRQCRKHEEAWKAFIAEECR